MKHFINNGIALGVQVVLAGSFSFLVHSDFSFIKNAPFYWITFLFCVLIYVTCGIFLLRPVKKSPVLSVLSLIIVSIGSLAICFACNTEEITGSMHTHMGEAFWAYMNTNPIAALHYIIDSSSIFDFDEFYLFATMFLPSSLMILGMVLRKCFQKDKKDKPVKESSKVSFYLANNGIAVAAHILLLVLVYGILIVERGLSSRNEEPFYWIALLVTTVGYLLCGFFLLRPVKRFSFLSVSFLPLAIVSVMIYASMMEVEGHVNLLFYLPNWYGFVAASAVGSLTRFLTYSVSDFILPNLLIWFILAPSFLMYLGLMLRRKVKRKQI